MSKKLMNDYKMTLGYRSRLQYEGSFVDRDGVKFTVHLLYRSYDVPWDAPPLDGVKPLRFGVEPVIISRDSERLSGLIPTTATLNLLSEKDGAFRELHRKPEGTVAVVVWKEQSPYYYGLLDPESYEEEYTKKKNYFVSLTFSDFGRAKRLRHKFKGRKSVGDWLRLAIKKSISYPKDKILPTAMLPVSPEYEWASTLMIRRPIDEAVEDGGSNFLIGDDLL